MANVFDLIQPTALIDEPVKRARNNKIRQERLSPSELREGKSRLANLSEESMETLQEAMRFAEYPAAIQAAKIVLDRSGFGPSSTLHIDVSALEEVPTEQLLSRGMELLGESREGMALLQKLSAIRTERTLSQDSSDNGGNKHIH